MSEYQFYEFRTIDRPFTAAERAEIHTWSSRAEVDSHKAQFVYHYSDFHKNIEDAMFQYFDAMVYYANFGCKTLMFRFPLALVNKKELVAYTFSDNIELLTKGDYVLLKIEENIQDGGYEDWIDEGGINLADLMGVRQQIINGDYRALYLAWLYFHSPDSKASFPDDYYEEEEENNEDDTAKMGAIEPPLPPHLKHLGSDLQHFADFWGLSEDWISAAAVGSKEKVEDIDNKADFIAKLPEAEKADFLLRLANQEVNLGAVFLKRLKELEPKQKTVALQGRKVQEIAELAEEIKGKRLFKDNEIAQQKRLETLEKTHKNRLLIWTETVSLLALQTANGYDKGVENMENLYKAAEHFEDLPAYKAKLAATLAPHRTSKALMKRLKYFSFI